MIIDNIKPFAGQHCETTATGTLINNLGIKLSEPMLFGLGEGLSYIFWNMKSLAFPFIGGRIKPDELTKNICSNLGLKLIVQQTSSASKAWELVKQLLDQKIGVGLKLDCFYLEYFQNAIHFAAHYVAIYGYDDTWAYLVDTHPQGGCVKTSLKSLGQARAAKGPMASKNLFYYIELTNRPVDLTEAIRQAIQNNVKSYLNPAIKNISYLGIIKTAHELVKGFQNNTIKKKDFCIMANLMEKAGTGGALFRNLYRDFLFESGTLLKDENLLRVSEDFAKIANNWTCVATLLDIAGQKKEITPLLEASQLLEQLAAQEKQAMALLAN